MGLGQQSYWRGGRGIVSGGEGRGIREGRRKNSDSGGKGNGRGRRKGGGRRVNPVERGRKGTGTGKDAEPLQMGSLPS
jgi:hypothetical protein